MAQVEVAVAASAPSARAGGERLAEGPPNPAGTHDYDDALQYTGRCYVIIQQ